MEQVYQEAEQFYLKVVEFARRNQPERIQIRRMKLHNEQLKSILEQGGEDETVKLLSGKFEQLVVQFELAKTSKMGKMDFLVKLRRILQIKQGDVSSSSRLPHQLNNSQYSSESAGGINQFRYKSSTKDQHKLIKVPSMTSDIINFQTGRFGGKDLLDSNDRYSHKTPKLYESNDAITQSINPPVLYSSNLNTRLNSQISHIKMFPQVKESNSINIHVPPIQNIQTIQQIKNDHLAPYDQVHTPFSGLNQIPDFSKSHNFIRTNQQYIQGFGGPYFPEGIQSNSKQVLSSSSLQSNQKQINYQQQNVYKINIQNLFKKAEILKKGNSFRSQMVSPSERSKSKSKTKITSTHRIRNSSNKEQLFNRLTKQNTALKKQLEINNTKLMFSNKIKIAMPTETLDDHIIANKLLKQQNNQIYSKLKQLEQVIEELSKQNFQYKGYLNSNTGGSNKNLQKAYSDNEYSQNNPFSQPQQNIHNQRQRKYSSNRAPIVFPQQIGQLIDTQSYKSSPLIQFEQRQIQYNADYEGPIGNLDSSQRSLQNYSKQKSKIRSSGSAKNKYHIQSPSAFKEYYAASKQASSSKKKSISQRDFPEVNPVFYEYNNNTNRLNQSVRDNKIQQKYVVNNYLNNSSQERYYTANNISISKQENQINIDINNSNKSSNNINNQSQSCIPDPSYHAPMDFSKNKQSSHDQRKSSQSCQNNQNDTSSRQYQDFPRISNIDNSVNSQSPLPQILISNSIERSFQTFKINPSSQQNILPQTSNIQQPHNFRSKNRSSLLRNKVGFYKKSLVLIKNDPNFQLAFKKSDVSREMNTIRVILYINNKQNYSQNICFRYEYDDRLYSIKHGDRVSNIYQFSQGREELFIQIKNTETKYQFIVCHLTVGSTVVDIVLPIFFFKFVPGVPKESQRSTLVINHEKQFSPQFLSTLIPIIHKNPEQYLQFMKGQKEYIGQCCIQTIQGQTSIRLQWKDGTLCIHAPLNYLNLIAWTLSDI